MDWAWTPQSYRIKAKNNYHHRRHNSSQLPAAPAPGCPEILQGQASVVGQMLSMNGNGDESKPPASVAKPHKIYTPTTGWDLGNVPPTPPAFVRSGFFSRSCSRSSHTILVSANACHWAY